MGIPELLQFGQYGTVGLVIGYFVWRESNDRRDRKDETESRNKLASALAALTAYITGRPNV